MNCQQKGVGGHVAADGILLGHCKKVESIWLVSCAIGFRWRICKHNTTNDMFSLCKKFAENGYRENDDQYIQPEKKLKLGTS